MLHENVVTVHSPSPGVEQQRMARLEGIQQFAKEVFDQVRTIRTELLHNPLLPLLHAARMEVGTLRREEQCFSPSEMLVATIADLLPPTYPFDVRGIFRRARGTFITHGHSWFVVELPGEAIGDPSPWWRYIIDPALPDAYPQCVLLGPASPLLLAYYESRPMADPLPEGEVGDDEDTTPMGDAGEVSGTDDADRT